MGRPQHIIVAGAGAAGHSAATTLRHGGHDGPLTVVHGETEAPYNRTLVNKGVLPGVLSTEQIALPPLGDLDVQVVTARVVGLDARSYELTLDDGERLPYTALVAATGSLPRRIGSDQKRPGCLLQLHSVRDARQIRALLGDDPSSRTVILLGAGFVGAETASYLSGLGVTVHLVSRPALPMAHAVGDAIARRISDLHRDHVETYFGREVVQVRAGYHEVTVSLDDGTRLEADFAIAAHGTTPTSHWLDGRVEGHGAGTVVDDHLRAIGLPRVFAAGGMAVHGDRAGGRYRIDHWDSATAQGAHAARTLMHEVLGGEDPGPYVPTTGFTLSVYGKSVAAYGVPLPGSEQRDHATGDGAAVLTTFHPGGKGPTAAAALDAGRELFAVRPELIRP